ncbi:hypothetical protein BC629DRAFT_1589524 [Irpex lacteus]|nr:hypothetical protein BC629DRAFT_1589524 [Irpex lacteus]
MSIHTAHRLSPANVRLLPSSSIDMEPKKKTPRLVPASAQGRIAQEMLKQDQFKDYRVLVGARGKLELTDKVPSAYPTSGSKQAGSSSRAKQANANTSRHRQFERDGDNKGDVNRREPSISRELLAAVEDVSKTDDGLYFWAAEYARRTPLFEPTMPPLEGSITVEAIEEMFDEYGVSTEMKKEELEKISILAKLPIRMNRESEAETLRIRAAVYRSLLERAKERIFNMTLIAKVYEKEIELIERQALLMLDRPAQETAS